MYLSSGCSVPLRTFFLLMCQLSSNVTSGSSLLFPPDAIFTLDSDPAPGTYSCPCCKLLCWQENASTLYHLSYRKNHCNAISFLHRSELWWGRWDCSIDHSFPLCNKRKRKSKERRTWETAPLQLHSMKGHYFIMFGDSSQVSW